MTESTITTTPASERPRLRELIGLAARRGVRGAPFAAAVGAIFGLIGGGGADSSMTASETSLVMAALLGFGFVPAAVAAIGVARRLRYTSGGTVSRWSAGIGFAALAGVVWGGIGALVTYGAGTLVDLNLNLGGLLTMALGVTVVVGASAGLLVMLAALTTRTPAATAMAADCAS